MTSIEIVSAYRALYRTALQAVRYSTPARYQIRDIIRTTFRHDSPQSFNPRRIANTVKFLTQARDYRGMEHTILRNILHSSYWRGAHRQGQRPPPWLRGNDDMAVKLRRNIYAQLDITITMLNESMDLCLRSLALRDQDPAHYRSVGVGESADEEDDLVKKVRI